MRFIDNWVARALDGKIPIFIFFVALVMGFFALKMTPREEEPQIVVPMLDILVDAPNVEAHQVERQVTIPLEKLLSQVKGVEHVYSTTERGRSVVTMRFFVGENREHAILNTYTKLNAYQHTMPKIVSNWQIRPIEVDDVPVMMLGLWSSDATLYSDYELRRFAKELSTQIQSIENTSEVHVVGGRKRAVQIYLESTQLSAYNTTVLDVARALSLSSSYAQIGGQVSGRQQIKIEVGDAFRELEQLDQLVVNMINGKAVYLSDVATIVDGPVEQTSYQWFSYGNSHTEQSGLPDDYPMVTISVAKQTGSNAVALTKAVQAKIAHFKNQLLAEQIHIAVLRDYGETANSKVNDLVSSLAFAVLTVIVFIGVFLGGRPAIVVGLAVPICYGITLALDMLFGYTINRVTLFALILSLGLLVDDPITGIDNIKRYITGQENKSSRIIAAMTEIRPALIMSTVTIILAFIPMAFITGMMGPYMAPMAFNVPVSVIASTLVAFFVTPWLASKLLKPTPTTQRKSTSASLYRRILTPLLKSPQRSKYVLWGVLGLFVVSAALPLFRAVPLKLLPFDNKNEIQILIEMPESSSLEFTMAQTQQVASRVKTVAEVSELAAYVGIASPMDFNGMVRRYYMRNMNYHGELRLKLIDKTKREHQSHGVVLRLRQLLAPLNRDGVTIKVVEVPPGPPVLSTVVAEVYRDAFVDLKTHQQAAKVIAKRLASEAHVVEVDTTISAPVSINRFITEREKAALSGISQQDIVTTLAAAGTGIDGPIVATDQEAETLSLLLRLPISERIRLEDISKLYVRGQQGYVQQDLGYGVEAAPQPLVALSELGEFKLFEEQAVIHRKDLQPVIYVTAELNGRTPAEVIADINADQQVENKANQSEGTTLPWQQRSFLSNGGGLSWQIPEGTSLSWSGEGELKITVRVFRDMGIAFAFALAGIFIILRLQTGSAALAGIIMSAIPLTVIGIMPGFWLMNQFGEREIAGSPEPVLFTATAMIGMIALAGIVVRNSLILVEFISAARASGAALKDALIEAGSVRMRPVLLTAGTTLLGNLVIILDPVFSGLALAIIFGIVASTLFSLFVVPLVYFLVFRGDDQRRVIHDT